MIVPTEHGGTRVLVRTVVATLVEGATPEEVLADFPTLTIDDVRAVIALVAAGDLDAAG